MATTKKATTKKKDVVVGDNSLICGACNKKLAKSNFYKSYNVLHASGYLPYCKDCVRKLSYDEDNEFNVEKFKNVLRILDRPYIHTIMQTSINDVMETVGCYMKNIAMVQYRDLTWQNSSFDIVNETIDNSGITKFKITDEMIDKWGMGYSNEMYEAFERKYNKLSGNYTEKTALHTENLLTYIRFRVQEEFCTARGDSGGAKNWGKMAQEAGDKAKLNVNQLSASDLSEGIDTISQLFEAVEQHASIIPVMPKLLAQPYDDADLIIWAIINYQRRLVDLPMVEYRDIWNFYDQMLEDHYLSKGYDETRIKQEKKKRNNVFRDLGEVYIEPLYKEDGDSNG